MENDAGATEMSSAGCPSQSLRGLGVMLYLKGPSSQGVTAIDAERVEEFVEKLRPICSTLDPISRPQHEVPQRKH